MATAVFTIPPHRSFADALAAGLMDRFGATRLDLAQGILLVPNNRAARAIQEAFVRRSGGGLLLPRLIPLGDPDLDERIGPMLEPLGRDAPIPPAIEPVRRTMRLARLVQRHLRRDAAESLRLADELGRTLDQLLVEEIEPRRLSAFAAEMPELSIHWQKSLDQLRLILDEWPVQLAAEGLVDLADRRNRLMRAAARGWRERPPYGFVCAAGVTTAAPAAAALLRTVSRLPNGMVVLPGLDLATPAEEWEALGPHEPDPASGRRRRALETHPQFHLKLLLDRIDIGRDEVRMWRRSGGRASPPSRGRAVAHALAPPAFTQKWQQLLPRERRLSGVRALEAGDPAEEAQAVALALREALEQPGRTAALITPDRALAARVAAHLRRWGIEADDSAGRPLSQTPPGTFLLALVSAAAQRFAPVGLLALLKHPLTMSGERRLVWLDGVRQLDLALRGPRSPAGLDGIAADLAENGQGKGAEAQLALWWQTVRALLGPLEQAFERDGTLPGLLGAVREAADRLGGDAIWTGIAGRAAAELFAELEAAAGEGPYLTAPAELPVLLERLMSGVAVRPPYGQHPRLFIWGLLEARLQRTDLMILAGLNEGTWPALPAPDPWLAPRLRSDLGLPSLDRRIGLAAHDFAGALGAPEVLVTRARRDARGPAVASRFWLRLEAMTGGIARSPKLAQWARGLDRPPAHRPAARPAPCPAERPRSISVTEVDRLKADPFAFYARRVLGLRRLDPVDADPTAAWRGSAVHEVLEQWMKEDDCDPSRLRPRAEQLLAGAAAHPLMRALWQPRLMEAIDFISAEVERNREAGRLPTLAEAKGKCELEGIVLRGIVDRIDRRPDGSLVIIDYKTGQPPSNKAVSGGFSLQLGLLGLIAERGGFEGVTGKVAEFEYWSLARKRGRLGHVASPVGGRSGIEADDFTALAARNFAAVSSRWLTGSDPFTAKLHPEYSPYGDYDQLMRLDEWYGRDG